MQAFTKCPAYCKGCIYRTQGKTRLNMCQYAMITGQLRGCPADEHCTRKTTKKPRQDGNSKRGKEIVLIKF